MARACRMSMLALPLIMSAATSIANWPKNKQLCGCNHFTAMEYTQLRSKLQGVLREAASSQDGTATLRAFMSSLGDTSSMSDAQRDSNLDALAHAFQLELTNCIQECCRNGVAFHNTAAGPALLRLAISAACSGSHFVARNLPLTMLGDVFENQTSAQAEQLFTLVEDSMSQLARLLVNDQGVAGPERYIIIKVLAMPHVWVFFRIPSSNFYKGVQCIAEATLSLIATCSSRPHPHVSVIRVPTL